MNWVRVLPGSQHAPLENVGRFLPMLRFENRGKLDNLGLEIDTNTHISGN